MNLILTLVIFTSCADTEEKIKFQESDKAKMIFQDNILSKKYLKTVEFKNPIYEMRIDSVLLDTSFEYESELWKNDKMIGGFVSSTSIHPHSDLNNMDDFFLSYIAGHNFEEFISPNFRYERTFEFELPFKKYRVYKMFKNDTLNIGLAFNILKENKIIFTSIVTNDKFELTIDEFINKLNEI